MENNFDNNFTNDLPPAPARPQFLKILCILTFVWSGIMILIYLLGSFTLAINEETGSKVMDKVLESNPNLQIDNPAEFFHQIGMVCLMALFANIVSLVGAIMMWNLNKIGLFLYAAAEIGANFIGMNMNLTGGDGAKSYGGMMFSILIDIVFIAMFAANLKHMNKNKAASISN